MKLCAISVVAVSTMYCWSTSVSFAGDAKPFGQIPESLDPPLDVEMRMSAEPPPLAAVPVQTVTPAAAAGFLGLDDDGTSIPPDTCGAVGPDHLMVMLNTQVRIQNRAGTTNYSTTSLSNWWRSAGSFFEVFDPRVLYDPSSNRWIAVAVGDSYSASSCILIAVSQTSDPTGAWYKHKIDADSGNTRWADYPTVGFNSKWIVVQANMFTNNSPYNFVRSQIYAFNKTLLRTS